MKYRPRLPNPESLKNRTFSSTKPKKIIDTGVVITTYIGGAASLAFTLIILSAIILIARVDTLYVSVPADMFSAEYIEYLRGTVALATTLVNYLNQFDFRVLSDQDLIDLLYTFSRIWRINVSLQNNFFIRANMNNWADCEGYNEIRELLEELHDKISIISVYYERFP